MTSPAKKPYFKWTLWGTLGLLIVVCIAAWFKLASLWLGGFQPQEMAAAQYSKKDVVGNLGGLPVRLPRYAVELVEYDGDPGWSGRRQSTVPERTMDSRLTSFGFDIRYPDMQMVDSYAIEKEKRSQSIYNTMWIRVGVRSGEIYPKDGFLDRQFACLIFPRPAYCGESDPWWGNDYERLPKPEHSLTVYVLKGVEPRSGQPARAQKSTKDVFVAKDAQGRVRTYINCSNVGHAAAPCGHDFSMEYDGMHAVIEIRYRRGLLPHWQDIQSKVANVMLGFVVSAPPVSTEASAAVTKP